MISCSEARFFRTQWNVGQGGFHSAEMETAQGDSRVRYVYDCGSHDRDALHAALQEYQERLSITDRLDVLVLSHIDEDHINGVMDLIETPGLRVDRVLLPLLTPAERLISLARTSASADQETVRLIVDPRGTLLRAQPDADIIEVEGGEVPAPSADAEPIEPDFVADGRRSTIVGDRGRSGLVTHGGPKVITHGAGVRFDRTSEGPDWLLTFYLAPHVESRRTAFLEQVSRLLAVGLSELESLTPNGLRELVARDGALESLRSAYKAAKVDTNASSLLMLSAPASDDCALDVIRFGQDRYCLAGTAWLHTADARVKKRRAAALRSHFGRIQLAAVGTLTLPHHGSARDFHPDLLAAVPNVRMALAMSGPYGEKHRWRHPSPEVLDHVEAANATPWIVSDRRGSRVRSAVDVIVPR